ncbi:MAG: hypothetical protein ACP5OC_00010 [Thermoplasmata archaeon]
MVFIKDKISRILLSIVLSLLMFKSFTASVSQSQPSSNSFFKAYGA